MKKNFCWIKKKIKIIYRIIIIIKQKEQMNLIIKIIRKFKIVFLRNKKKNIQKNKNIKKINYVLKLIMKIKQNKLKVN